MRTKHVYLLLPYKIMSEEMTGKSTLKKLQCVIFFGITPLPLYFVLYFELDSLAKKREKTNKIKDEFYT